MNKIEKMIMNINYVDSFLANNNFLVPCLTDCNACCYDYFYVSMPEFYLSLYGLTKLPVNIDFYHNKALKTFEHFSLRYNNEVKRMLPNSLTLIDSHLNDYEEGEYTNYQNLPPCIFLNSGRCSIYKYRPNTCRKYGTTITCEYINNRDLQSNDFVNYNIFSLIENTQLINKDNNLVKTYKYPLWFIYAYFLKEEFRPYVFSELNNILSLSEDDYISTL